LAELGDVTIAALTSARSTKKFYKTARERANHRYRTKVAVERLAERGLLQRRGEIVAISESGNRALSMSADATRKTARGKTWDGKWRIVSFDIPERLRILRYEVRSILKRSGFKKLQQSLWVFPYDCDELVALIKRESRLKGNIFYATIERSDDDFLLAEAFKGLLKKS